MMRVRWHSGYGQSTALTLRSEDNRGIKQCIRDCFDSALISEVEAAHTSDETLPEEASGDVCRLIKIIVDVGDVIA